MKCLGMETVQVDHVGKQSEKFRWRDRVSRLGVENRVRSSDVETE